MPVVPPLRLVDGAGRDIPSESDKIIANAVKALCEELKPHSPAWVVCVATADGDNSINAAGGDPFMVMKMAIASVSATASAIEKNVQPPKLKEPTDGP